MNALKTFTSGGGEGNSQGEFIGHAMAQAGKLFDEQHSAGNVAPSANKQDAISHAAQMAYKLYTKSGNGGGGGPGGLLGKLL
ncbi:MAG: hypothetical protein M1839_001501 [Geoglossum umbratile]|nr:MAG: hypothetical protein M1839_001501 [Geoglossum umbratile]